MLQLSSHTGPKTLILGLKAYTLPSLLLAPPDNRTEKTHLAIY